LVLVRAKTRTLPLSIWIHTFLISVRRLDMTTLLVLWLMYETGDLHVASQRASSNPKLMN
jgi:hypothetical protein